MICVAVCDDESYILDKICKLVQDFFCMKKMEIKLVKFSSGEELLRFGREIDILFLDIQMKNMDGMQVAKRLRDSGFHGFLIFVTVLKELVFQAFEVQAFDYLVKPVDEEHFHRVMERLSGELEKSEARKLFVHIGNERRIVAFDDIVYCEVIDRKMHLHLLSAEIVEYYDRIENVEVKLDRSFFRCHRSYLINLKYLQSFKNNTAYMKGGEQIPVSRLRGREFSGIVLEYMSGRR